MSGELTAFFYGTLMAPEVFFSVCYGQRSPPAAVQKLHAFTPAVLDGFCRHRVQRADYPGIVPEEGHSVRGIYATGLTEANMQKLDHYEGDEYVRETVRVRLDGGDGPEKTAAAAAAAAAVGKQGEEKEGGGRQGGIVKETNTYVFLYPEALEKREWDFEEFRRDKMQMWTRNGYCEV